MISLRVLLLLALFLSQTTAFVPLTPRQPLAVSGARYHPTTGSALAERRWNFNEGQSPWGLKKNAEIWNGRVAQVSLVAFWNAAEDMFANMCYVIQDGLCCRLFARVDPGKRCYPRNPRR